MADCDLENHVVEIHEGWGVGGGGGGWGGGGVVLSRPGAGEGLLER